MNDLLKVHHYDSKGKLIKKTPRRIVQSRGKPDLVIKLDTDVNKFVYLDGTPYDENLIPDKIKKEFAYLFEKDEEVQEETQEEVADVEEIDAEEVEEVSEDKEE